MSISPHSSAGTPSNASAKAARIRWWLPSQTTSGAASGSASVTAMPRMKACVSLRNAVFPARQAGDRRDAPRPGRAGTGAPRRFRRGRAPGSRDRSRRPARDAAAAARRPCRLRQRRAAKGRPTCHRAIRPVGQRVDADEPRAPCRSHLRAQRPSRLAAIAAGPGDVQPVATAASVSNTCQPRSSQLTSPPPCAAC
jgi:hypothetical protein